MGLTTGLFQFSPYQSDQFVPALAELATDPLGQVVAVITAYLPEGTGSSYYDWQRCFFLRADFAREKIDLVLSDDGQYYAEGEWDLDVHDEDAREELLVLGAGEPEPDALATLATWAPDLRIASPDPKIRAFWGEDGPFREGVPTEDWAGPA